MFLVLLNPPDTDNAAIIGLDSRFGRRAARCVRKFARRNSNAHNRAAATPTRSSPRAHNSSCIYPSIAGVRLWRQIEERRRALVGFVFSRLRPDTMFSDRIIAAAPPFAGHRSPRQHRYQGTVAAHVRPTSCECRGDGAAVNRRPTMAADYGLRRAEHRRVAAGGPTPPGQRCPALVSRIRAHGAQVRAWRTSERHAAELRAADRAKDEFLAAPHELRTPLNAMLGWLTMLRSGSIREERQAHALHIMIGTHESRRNFFIDDLLEVSRILMGKMRLEKRPLSVVPAITSVIDSLRPSAEAKASLHGIELANDGTFVTPPTRPVRTNHDGT